MDFHVLLCCKVILMDRGEVYKAYPCKLSVLSLFVRGECCERLKVLAFLVFQLLDAFLAYLASELHASLQSVIGSGLVYLDVGVGAKVQVDVSVDNFGLWFDKFII